MKPALKHAARAGFLLVILLECAGWVLRPGTASDFTWLGLLVTAIFAWSMMEVFRLSWVPFWLSLVAVIIDAISALYELYSRIEPWDRWVHTWGGAVIAVGALELVRRGLRKEHIGARRHGPFIAASVYLLVTAIGFLYEFWEYLVDRTQYGYPRSLVSAYNSIEDQLFNLLGATIVLAFFFLWRYRLHGDRRDRS